MGKGAVVLALSSALAAAPANAASPTQVASANREAAIGTANQLLGDVVPPQGTTEVPDEPAGSGRQLDRPVIQFFFAAQVDRRMFWTTDASPSSVMASFKAHLPPEATLLSTGYGGPMLFAAYAWPVTDPATLGPRQLVLETVPLAGDHTGIRADAEVRYVAPRLLDQQVPPQARVLDVTLTDSRSRLMLSLHITRRGQVRRVARLVDSLPFGGNRSGVAFSCPSLGLWPLVRFTFRSSVGGRVLASVSEPADTPLEAGPCETTSLTVRGHHEPSLLDGGTLLRKAGAVLGVRLTRKFRRAVR